MWTNFADNGKIHTCMYNVCTMYVQCTPRQLAWFHHGSWRVICTEMNTIFGATFVGHRMYNVCTVYVRAMKVSQWLTEVYRERWFVEVLSASCSRETVSGEMLAGNVRLASLARHTLRLWALTRPSAQPTVPCHGKGKGRAITYEQLFICRLLDTKESICLPVLFVGHEWECLSNVCSISIFYVCNEWRVCSIWVRGIIS